MRKPRTTSVAVGDDDDHLRRALCLLIGDLPGFTVVGDARTTAGVEVLVRQRRPRILVLDLIDGPAFLVELLRIAPRLRVIVYTGHDAEGRAERMLAAGAFAYVVKSGRLEDLVVELRRAAAL